MTDALKPGRPKSPCAKCGGTERNANGQCIPCNREYMRKYRKDWVAERRKKINQEKEKHHAHD